MGMGRSAQGRESMKITNSTARRFLATASIAVVVCVTPALAADHLTVLNWKGWGTDAPWAIAKSKDISGKEAVHDYISSFAESFTKLRTNPGAYDVTDFNVAFTKQAADEG